MTNPALESFWTEYLDGSVETCQALDADEALEILARDTEMVHGPIKGQPPEGATE